MSEPNKRELAKMEHAQALKAEREIKAELLEALKATLETVMARWLRSGDGHDSSASEELLCKVKAAIAKAEATNEHE